MPRSAIEPPAGGAFQKGNTMVGIHRKDIIISTNEGDIRIRFSPAQPRAYTELMKAVSAVEKMRDEALQLAKSDKALAGAFIIDGEMGSLIAIKDAIRAALLPGEWEKLEGFIDYIDIGGMLEIASAILNAYTDHYRHRLTDGLEK